MRNLINGAWWSTLAATLPLRWRRRHDELLARADRLPPLEVVGCAEGRHGHVVALPDASQGLTVGDDVDAVPRKELAFLFGVATTAGLLAAGPSDGFGHQQFLADAQRLSFA